MLTSHVASAKFAPLYFCAPAPNTPSIVFQSTVSLSLSRDLQVTGDVMHPVSAVPLGPGYEVIWEVIPIV